MTLNELIDTLVLLREDGMPGEARVTLIRTTPQSTTVWNAICVTGDDQKVLIHGGSR